MLPLLALAFACTSQTQWPEEPPADPCAAGALPDEEIVSRFAHGDGTRSALIWPGSAAGPRDVVVNLHEFRAEPRRQNHYSGWVPLAREAGAILVGPDGRYATWNAGGCCGKASERNVNDTSFLDEVVQRVDAVACTSGKVLATGIGNGAMMTHRWACESDTVDGIISVGGALQLPSCAQERPIPVLHYHGEKDTYFPADGSAKGLRPLEESLATWRARNQTVDEPVIETWGDLTCRTWEGAAPVRSCLVRGMGAQWPGAADTEVQSDSPLRHAATGGLEWIRQHW